MMAGSVKFGYEWGVTSGVCLWVGGGGVEWFMSLNLFKF